MVLIPDNAESLKAFIELEREFRQIEQTKNESSSCCVTF
jgi:hypothetical protein